MIAGTLRLNRNWIGILATPIPVYFVPHLLPVVWPVLYPGAIHDAVAVPAVVAIPEVVAVPVRVAVPVQVAVPDVVAVPDPSVTTIPVTGSVAVPYSRWCF